MTDAHFQQNHVPTHFPISDANDHDVYEDKLYVDLNTTNAAVKQS